MSELKPCPFCGSTNIAAENMHATIHSPGPFMVFCRECNTEAPADDGGAIASWNTRPSPWKSLKGHVFTKKCALVLRRTALVSRRIRVDFKLCNSDSNQLGTHEGSGYDEFMELEP